MNYAIIGVEGNSDQVFVSKVLKLLGFKDFKEQHKGLKSKLDPFWYPFIPKYPKKDEGNLYQRLDMPSILFNDNISVAIYAGEGSNLITNLDDLIYANSDYQNNISAFGIVADCDRDNPENIVKKYYDTFQLHFSNFPQQCGIVDLNIPRTGIYILPDIAVTRMGKPETWFLCIYVIHWCHGIVASETRFLKYLIKSGTAIIKIKGY